MQDLTVVLDSRIRFPPGLSRSFLAALKRIASHPNPDFHKKKAMGFATYGVDSSITTWELHDKGTPAESISLPRGVTKEMREVAKEHGFAVRILDRRTRHESVEWPALHFTPRWYQDLAVEACMRFEQGIIRAPTGCISGDAVIGVNRAGKSFKLSLRKLVEQFQLGASGLGRTDPSIPWTVRARHEDGTIRLTRLVDAWSSGRKMVYRITTADGHETRATADHRFLTGAGWKRLGEIVVGDRLFVEGKRLASPRLAPKKWYRLVNGLKFHPHAGRRGVASHKGGYSVPVHRLVVEASLNAMPYQAFVERVRCGRVDGLKFIDPVVWAVHHKDGDHTNNDIANLEVLTHGQHRAAHADENTKNVLYPTVTSEVIGIVRVGIEETYDLQLEAPHNFLADGIVVHNSGKTLAALTLAQEIQQPALVIMRDSNLLDQWLEVAVEKAGLHEREIGVLKGSSKLRTGARLTLALQQTLYSPTFPLDEVASRFGLVIVDEVHTVAAKTFQAVIGNFPARYRIGFSADETRKDKKECLVYDQFGRVIYEIERDKLEDEGAITPVEVVLIPTDFRADWYRFAPSGERDFNRLLNEITQDEERNKIITRLVKHLSVKENPTLVFTHRIEHARALADVELFAASVRCGLLLGGDENRVRFAEDKARLKSGDLPVCTGTFAAVGQGIDMPAVRSGVMSTPIGNNRQFFGQVRGRICRPAADKSIGRLFVIWDQHVFPDMPKKFATWNSGRTSTMDVEELLRAT